MSGTVCASATPNPPATRDRCNSSPRTCATTTGSAPPPKHILNAPTGLMKDEGYGAGYAYDHDADDGFSGRITSRRT